MCIFLPPSAALAFRVQCEPAFGPSLGEFFAQCARASERHSLFLSVCTSVRLSVCLWACLWTPVRLCVCFSVFKSLPSSFVSEQYPCAVSAPCDSGPLGLIVSPQRSCRSPKDATEPPRGHEPPPLSPSSRPPLAPLVRSIKIAGFRGLSETRWGFEIITISSLCVHLVVRYPRS